MAPRLRRRKETEEEDAAQLKLGSGVYFFGRPSRTALSIQRRVQ